MSSISLVSFGFEGKNVRVVLDEKGNPWWVAKDVCDVLGIVNNRDALSRLDNDEKDDIISSDVVGGVQICDVGNADVTSATTSRARKTQEMTTINESGLYSLILTSRVESAKRFKKWVTSEVLPSIRKTGSYHVKPSLPPPPSSFNVNGPQSDKMQAVLMLGEMMMRTYGVKPGIAGARVLTLVKRNTDIDADVFKDALPAAEESTGRVNVTALGKLVDMSARDINKSLENLGLQVKQGKEWVLTEEGRRYGQAMPYERNGHTGYQILWSTEALGRAC